MRRLSGMVTGSGRNHKSQGRAGQKERGQDSKTKMLRRIQGPASQEREPGAGGKEIFFDKSRVIYMGSEQSFLQSGGGDSWGSCYKGSASWRCRFIYPPT